MPSTSSSARTQASGAALPARAAGDVWDGLAAELAELASLARVAESPGEFYAELLRRAAAALAAEGGAVWAPQPGGRMKQLALIDPAERPQDEPARREHEALLQAVARVSRVFAPNSTDSGEGPVNRTPYVLVIAPVLPAHANSEHPPAALVELSLRAGLSPTAYQAAEEFLLAACDVAAEFHALGDLSRLRALCDEQQRMLALGERVYQPRGLAQTAAAIANEARSAIGCDRVSVLDARGAGCRLLAVSGVDQPNRRSRTVRYLEQLARVSSRLGDPIYLADDQHDVLPQAAAALEKYADESHARQVAVVPMRTRDDDAQAAGQIVGVLVAENFDGANSAVARDRVTDAVRVCAPALQHARQLHAIPLAGVQTAFSSLTQPGPLLKLAIALAVLAAGVAALLLLPAELKIEARGQLLPVERRNVFAPGDGIIEQLMVEHGEQVTAGQVLATLRDPELDLEIKRLDGERRTVARQLESINATRSSLDARESGAVEAYRLSAEQQQLRQRQQALEEQTELLRQQRDALVIRSPQDGMVITWQLQENLLGRPVQRGQQLLAVAQTEAAWLIELDLPDDRIGYLLDAQRGSNEPLTVEYRLGSQEEGFETGLVSRIAQRADPPDPNAAPGAARIVKVEVTPDAAVSNQTEEVRPGASVRARVLCGQRSLGYVWMHDLVNAARVWWEF